MIKKMLLVVAFVFMFAIKVQAGWDLILCTNTNFKDIGIGYMISPHDTWWTFGTHFYGKSAGADMFAGLRFDVIDILNDTIYKDTNRFLLGNAGLYFGYNLYSKVRWTMGIYVGYQPVNYNY